MAKVYTVEDGVNVTDYWETKLPFGNGAWKPYAKFATSETARHFTYRPKLLLPVAFFAAFMIAVGAVALGVPALAAVGIVVFFPALFVKWPAQQWFFRKGNPMPIPRLDDLLDPKGEPVLDRTLDGTIEKMRQSEESNNLRDLVETQTNWMMLALVGFLGLFIGVTIGKLI